MAVAKSNISLKLDKEVALFLNEPRVKDLHFNIRTNINYDDFLSDKMLIIAAIRAGIPHTLFELISFNAPFTDNDWANFLDISTKSLQRYKALKSHYFKPIHSEKIIEMAEVTKVGLDVFGEMDRLKLWLNTPNYALGNLKPLELLKDSYGKELVLSELTRINHGILV